MSKYIILDCKKCGHYTSCKTPCIYVDTLVNGNDRPREQHIPDNIRDSIYHKKNLTKWMQGRIKQYAKEKTGQKTYREPGNQP